MVYLNVKIGPLEAKWRVFSVFELFRILSPHRPSKQHRVSADCRCSQHRPISDVRIGTSLLVLKFTIIINPALFKARIVHFGWRSMFGTTTLVTSNFFRLLMHIR